jgi:hypothetical protein
MHELVGSDHSMTHVVVDSCQGETRTSEHIGISPAVEVWTVANDNATYLVAALTCHVLLQPYTLGYRSRQSPCCCYYKGVEGTECGRDLRKTCCLCLAR